MSLFIVAFHWQTKSVELIAEPMLDIIWTKNKLNHHNILQLTVLSLLSTAVGPEHEPPLLRGVVSLQQTKSGTQCGAYGQWTGPFSYQCDTELLHDISSHPAVEQHYQLAYVGWWVANTKGHTEIDIFWQKNSSKCTTFLKRLTGQHQAVCNPITHFTSANYHMLKDFAQIPLWDAMICDTAIHSIPMGNIKHRRTSQGRRGGTNPIPRWSGHLTREVVPESTCVGEKNLHSEHFIVPGALNFYGAWGTKLLWCQRQGTFIVLGAQDFLKVPGAQVSHGTTEHGVGSDQARKAFHFLAATPLKEVTTWTILHANRCMNTLKF